MLELFVERSRDEKSMIIRTPRLRSGYKRLRSGRALRPHSKLLVERSRDENTGEHKRTNTGLHSPPLGSTRGTHLYSLGVHTFTRSGCTPLLARGATLNFAR